MNRKSEELIFMIVSFMIWVFIIPFSMTEKMTLSEVAYALIFTAFFFIVLRIRYKIGVKN